MIHTQLRAIFQIYRYIFKIELKYIFFKHFFYLNRMVYLKPIKDKLLADYNNTVEVLRQLPPLIVALEEKLRDCQLTMVITIKLKLLLLRSL